MENPGLEISSDWIHSLYHDVSPFLLQHAGGYVCACCVRVSSCHQSPATSPSGQFHGFHFF